MLPAFATETIAVYYPRIETSRGATRYVRQVDPTDMIHISGCSVQPTTSSSNLSEPRDETMTLMTAWVPEEQWVRVIAGGTTRDLVFEWRGMQFIQYGEAMPWISPTGNLGHVQIYLRAYKG